MERHHQSLFIVQLQERVDATSVILVRESKLSRVRRVGYVKQLIGYS